MSISPTEHYLLNQLDGTDKIDRAKFNENFQKIDTELYKSSVLYGIIAPTTATAGSLGQCYLDTVTGIAYRCLAVAGSVYTWVPTGVIVASAAPSTGTKASLGQLYFNSVTKLMYECVAISGTIYTWELVDNKLIGSYEFTKLTTLGSKYALANGASYSVVDYPELYLVLGGTKSYKANLIYTGSTTTYAQIIGSAKLNGNYVLWGNIHTTAAIYFPSIWYATSPDGPYTQKTIDTTSFSQGNTIYSKVIWDGTNYIATSMAYNGTAYTTYLYYSPTLDGTWTKLTLTATAIGANNATFFDYVNGVYIYVCAATIKYATSWANVLAGTWLTSTANQIYGNVIHDGTYWIAAGAGVVYWCATLSGTWSSKSLGTNLSGYIIGFNWITFVNGYYIVTGSANASPGALYYSYTTILNGTWTDVLICSASSYYEFTHVEYYKGMYIFLRKFGNGTSESTAIFATADITAGMTSAASLDGNTGAEWTLKGLTADEKLFFCGQYYNNTPYTVYVHTSKLVAGDQAALPTVTLTNTNVFIKIK